MKLKKAYLIHTAPLYRPGESAEIIGVVIITPDEEPPRACYHVRYKDGTDDFTAISEDKFYQIVSEDEIEERVLVSLEGCRGIMGSQCEILEVLNWIPKITKDTLKGLATTKIWIDLLEGKYDSQKVVSA